MSEPIQIAIEQIRVGDIVSVKWVWGDVSMTWEGPVFEVEPEVRLGKSGAYRIDPRTGSNVTLTLLHRPPTRRAITIDDLRDWQKVPIGTHVEFKCADTGSTVSGKLIVRTEANSWSITVSGHYFRYLSSIKPGTLFVIEEAKS